jgi:hypothetical protein
MTTAAHLVVPEDIVTVVGYLKRRVRVMGLSRVTGVAAHAATVDRFLEGLNVHVEGKPFAAGEGDAEAPVAVAV